MKIRRFGALLLLTLMIFGACDFSNVNNKVSTKEGKYGISYSIKDSKTREVFKEKLTGFLEVPLSNGDTVYVNSSWIEHKWTFKKDQGESQIQKGEQLIIEFEPNQLFDSYLLNWIIISKSTFQSLGSVGDNACFLRYSNDLKLEDREFVILNGGSIVKDSMQVLSRKIGEFALE